MTDPAASIHASAVKVGDIAVVIRGPSGSGKSSLAFQLILAGRARQIPAATLVGDDRIYLERKGDFVLARTVPALAGLIEIRGLGIRGCEHTNSAPVGLVVDLAASDATRLPKADVLLGTLLGITLPRVPVAAGHDALMPVLAALTLPEALTTGE